MTHSPQTADHTRDFATLDRGDVAIVGGKNASLGEMIGALGAAGVRVPPGFATTAGAFRAFLAHNRLEAVIEDRAAALEAGRSTLSEVGRDIRAAIAAGDWPEDIAQAIARGYAALCDAHGADVPVAVRSSATAEDLPEASFAGQQETFLNVSGLSALLAACRRCYASLYTDRAIAYRRAQGFGQTDVALSVGVQLMVRSDTGGSGVMFSIDTESGFRDVVVIDAAWGLGETVVQGSVDPDGYQVFKPFLGDAGLSPVIERRRGAKETKMVLARDEAGGTATRIVPTSRAERAGFVLSHAEILDLARQAVSIERHYGGPMDMEWARDGVTGELWIVQARPETVQSRAADMLRSYRVEGAGPVLTTGLSVGGAAVAAEICLIETAADIGRFRDGAILVTGTTDPDWVPVMGRAAGIVTDHGGRTSHAAIVSRELGVPAIVGTGDATHVLHDAQEVTLNCAGGEEGTVHAGRADIAVDEIAPGDLPETRTKVMLNVANPSSAFRWWRLPADGIGLARMEFVVTSFVRAHPMALLDPSRVADDAVRPRIEALIAGYEDGAAFFVDQLATGLARIAALAHPHPCTVRMSDFKSNEYADLLGGRQFEPDEENPMIGLRGASRYYDPLYRDAFALECRAIRRLRGEMGFGNVRVMIPFCRTVEEADRVLEVMAAAGLERGRDGLEIWMMCEVPSNVVRARDFATRFDGFSIGSNDLTQLTLGVDRDAEGLATLFRENDPAVMWMIEHVIAEAHGADTPVGFCGQAPSNDPDYARRLVAAGIDSVSVTPDAFVAVKRAIAEAERAAGTARRASG
jgi:pyruvate,water dikinase